MEQRNNGATEQRMNSPSVISSGLPPIQKSESEFAEFKNMQNKRMDVSANVLQSADLLDFN